jgi:hypothetical protein
MLTRTVKAIVAALAALLVMALTACGGGGYGYGYGGGGGGYVGVPAYQALVDDYANFSFSVDGNAGDYGYASAQFYCNAADVLSDTELVYFVEGALGVAQQQFSSMDNWLQYYATGVDTGVAELCPDQYDRINAASYTVFGY